MLFLSVILCIYFSINSYIGYLCNYFLKIRVRTLGKFKQVKNAQIFVCIFRLMKFQFDRIVWSCINDWTIRTPFILSHVFNKYSFTLYPACSTVGRRTLVLRQSGLRSLLSAEFWWHSVLSAGTQRCACPRPKSEESTYAVTNME